MEVELAFLKGLPESSNKLAAEHATEHLDGKKNRSRDFTQWARSSDSPPAEMTQWTWGWSPSF